MIHSKLLDKKNEKNNLICSEKLYKGACVKIKNSKNNKGHIIFEYKSLDQLNKIVEIIKANY